MNIPDPETRIALYRMMCRIRAFEDAAEQASLGGVAAFGQSAGGSSPVRGPLHLSTGQEAVPAGVCAHLRKADFLTSTHRGHGHTLAKGADPTRMVLELFGKSGGYCGGKGGSMHIADFSVGMLGANGVVAAGIPIAVGAAQSCKLQRLDAIAVTFFGDGAINRGPFGEGLNWAVAFGLPLLFVCEDNQWSATTHTGTLSAGGGAAERARAYGMRAVEVDGMAVEEVWQAAGELIESIRAGDGPALLHARTYRFKGHVSVDPGAYRDPTQLQAALQRDPLPMAARRMQDDGVADAGRIEQIRRQAQQEIEAAVATAAAAPWPSEQASTTDVQTVGAGRWL